MGKLPVMWHDNFTNIMVLALANGNVGRVLANDFLRGHVFR